MITENRRALCKVHLGRMFLAAAILATAILSLLVAGSGSAAVEPLQKAGGQGLPLAEVLPPDGTLALPDGFRGSLDARGWRLASGLEEALRLAPQEPAIVGQWADIFSPPGTSGGVSALAVDGDGNLYAGGAFTTAGTVTVNNIAKWDGSSWSTLGSGLGGDYPSHVCALAVAADGTLYAGGYFTVAGGVDANYVARWDGSSWSALGSGLEGVYDKFHRPHVCALAVDGEGNLYAGGEFNTAGGVSANNVALWDGASWSALGGGIGGIEPSVHALAVDGDGNLYAGGWFTTAGKVSANKVAMWDGSRWSAMGSGIGGSEYPLVYALAFSGDGNLYAGGRFTTAGGVSANYIAKWDGSTWSALGSGMNGTVSALTVDGDGNLYAGGGFSTAGEVGAHSIAKWDGSKWSALGSGMDGWVGALAVDGDGNLYAGGGFLTAGGASAYHIARWDSANWSAVGSGNGMSGGVDALAVAADGALYAGGDFNTVNGVIANHIAMWDGSHWSALGSGMSGTEGEYYHGVNALAVDGDGNLYAGTDFTTAGWVTANGIAMWDGFNWSALGSGTNGTVYALALGGDGNLYAGGWFTTAGGVGANHIARWDGSSWSALGGGMGGEFAHVEALTVDGDGNLYAGGSFTTAGGISADNIARWDGSRWSVLGSGTNGTVSSLAVDGDGNLYAGGSFSTAGGMSANNIARWDGSSWSPLGGGMGGEERNPGPLVSALAVDGDGTLYAGGEFTTAGRVSANYIARWDGSSWSALDSGMGGAGYYTSVSALAVDGDGALYAGGYFTTAGGRASSYIALWITAPYAAFSGSPRSGIVPLTVRFTNHSVGDLETCTWNFGDGGTSTDCNDPSYHYTEPGVYAVTLTVSGPEGSDTETKIKYITVNEYGSRLPLMMGGK